MLYIKNLEDGVELFKALGSDVRINIIKLLLKNREMNMNEIASSLNITNGALTGHIKKMEDAGLIRVTGDAVGHGNQKMCSVALERILVDIVRRRAATQAFTRRKSLWGSILPTAFILPAAFPPQSI